MTELSGAVSHDPRLEERANPQENTQEKRTQTPEEIVSRLQARIVKAQEAGKWNKARVLQRLLVRSHSARLLAVERVSHNDGKKTPGVDGET